MTTEPNQRESPRTDVPRKAPGTGVLGFAVFGACAIGVLSAIAAIEAMDSSDFTAAGICLSAGALSFGLLLNAFLR